MSRVFFGEFVCTRISDCGDGCPCEGAVKVSLKWVDCRTVDDPMKNQYIGASWYEAGKNHRVENGMIARDLECERWVVSIPNERAFRDFVIKNGEVIVSFNKKLLPPAFEIEIYDGYRE